MKVWLLLGLGVAVFGATFYAMRELFKRRSGRPRLPVSVSASAVNERRLRIAGIHHITVICKDVERSVDFYRNLLGLRLVKQTVNEDDRGARHLFFGDEEGRPGTLITCLEYAELDEGTVGRARPTISPSRSTPRRSSSAGATTCGRAGTRDRRDGPHLLQVALPARPRRPHRRAGHRGPGPDR